VPEPSAPAVESIQSTKPSRIAISADDPVGAAAQNALKAGLVAVEFYEVAAREGEIEAIHQLRVANRRLRAAVELFANVLHGSRVNYLRRELHWLGNTAGATRESDVTEQLMRKRSVRLDSASQDSLAPIFEELSSLRRVELAKIGEMFSSKRYRMLLERVASTPLRKLPPTTLVRGTVTVMLRPIARTVRRTGGRLGPDSAPEEFHRLRIRTKRLRYALEMTDEMTGRRGRKAVKRLTEMQDLLGSHHDAVIAIAWLRRFADTANAPPTALLAAGALIQSLHRLQIKLTSRSLERWKKLERDGIIRKALAEVARHARPQDQAPAVPAA
jgi:CHAD domain-containing protein